MATKVRFSKNTPSAIVSHSKNTAPLMAPSKDISATSYSLSKNPGGVFTTGLSKNQ